jgi:hypothetical protein
LSPTPARKNPAVGSISARKMLAEWECRMTAYEIYALKYAGPFKSAGAFLMWFKEWDRCLSDVVQGVGKGRRKKLLYLVPKREK